MPKPNSPSPPAGTPINRLSQRVQELLSLVRVERLSVDPRRESPGLLGQLLALQVREKLLGEILEEIELIQNGSVDVSKETDVLGADDLPPLHEIDLSDFADDTWVED